MIKPSVIFASLLWLLVMTSSNVFAQEKPPALAEYWTMVLKPEQSDAFYPALAEHVKVRTQAGDPMQWEVYTPLLGDQLNRVVVRACCYEWSDFDAYGAWLRQNKNVNQHFQEQVAPHVERYAHGYSEVDWEHSHWKKEHGPFTHYAVTEFFVAPGKMARFNEARAELSRLALDKGWASDQHVWAWTRAIGGEPTISLVVPHRNFADMAESGESFGAYLARVMGSDETAGQLMQRFSESVTRQEYQIWVRDDSLSMHGGD